MSWLDDDLKKFIVLLDIYLLELRGSTLDSPESGRVLSLLLGLKLEEVKALISFGRLLALLTVKRFIVASRDSSINNILIMIWNQLKFEAMEIERNKTVNQYNQIERFSINNNYNFSIGINIDINIGNNQESLILIILIIKH